MKQKLRSKSLLPRNLFYITIGAVVIFLLLSRFKQAPLEPNRPEIIYKQLLTAMVNGDMHTIDRLTTTQGKSALLKSTLRGDLKTLGLALQAQTYFWPWEPPLSNEESWGKRYGQWKGPRSRPGRREWTIGFIRSSSGWKFSSLDFAFPIQDVQNT